MRMNRFVAMATGMSRRKADEAIAHGRVAINGALAKLSDYVETGDRISLDGISIKQKQTTTIVMNKPRGYVCSRNGQGNKTVYDLLPKKFDELKTVGRLDKDSSGLLLLSNDGELINKLTHPSYEKEKVYRVTLDRKLDEQDKSRIERGVNLDDGLSRLTLEGHELEWLVRMHEGRNRQIRRTFKELGYDVLKLHRVIFGDYHIGNISPGKYKEI